jgi:hypothetical protein
LITPKPAAQPVGEEQGVLHLQQIADLALQRDGAAGVADERRGARAMHAELLHASTAASLIAGCEDRLR